MRDGHLPALARLAEHGLWARTGGPELLCEHGMWVGIFSGVSRAKHGFNFFRQLRPGTYELEMVSGADLGVDPLWADLPDSRRVLVIDAPDTPPVPGVEGGQLAEWATHSHYPPIPLRADPPELLQAAERHFGPREPIGEEIGATTERDHEIVERLVARTEKKGRLVRGLMEEAQVDLVVAVFAEAHTGSHQGWEYRRDAKGDGPRDPARLGDGILRLYQAIDREIGATVEAAGPEATVFVVGSVGLKSQYPTEELAEAVLRDLGYQASPPPTDGGGPGLMGVLRALLPEAVRNALSQMLPRDKQEQFVSDKFKAGTDWGRTRAFALPGYYSTAVRLNLAGREPEGTVAAEAADDLMDAIERDFLALTDVATGEPVVDRVVRFRAPDVHGPDAHLALPDLFVLWRPHDRPIEAVRLGDRVIRQSRHAFDRGSDHSTSGFVLAAGPSVPRLGNVGEVSPLAVAPSVRRALGTPVPDRMETPPLDAFTTP